MPISIPYNHPSLVLGGIADTKVMEKITQMRRVQSQTDAAQEKLTSLMQMKRSMTMTLNELKGMEINVEAMQQKLVAMDAEISASAEEYLSVFLQNEEKLCKLKQELGNTAHEGEVPESPVDFASSSLVEKPFYAESMKLDSQYFSMGSNSESEMVAHLEKFVRDSAGGNSEELAQTASAQMSSQAKNHKLCGTLVIVASCTHRIVGLFDPLVIDPDKAVRAWNKLHEGGNQINLPGQGIASEGGGDEEPLTLITGAAYGSSFVGMVHLLQTEDSQIKNIDGLQKQLAEKLQIGGWLSSVSGGLGIDPELMNEVKSFLSSQSVSTHISVVSMGMIPTLKSNTLQSGIGKLTEISPDTLNHALRKEGEGSTIGSESEDSARRSRHLEAQDRRAKRVIEAMADVDREQSKVMDLNSLMTALDNYIQGANSPKELHGVPISFYTRNLTRSEIIRLWMKKHYPISATDKKEEKSNAEE